MTLPTRICVGLREGEILELLRGKLDKFFHLRVCRGLEDDSDYGNPAAQNHSSPSPKIPTNRSNEAKTNNITKQNTGSNEGNVS